MESPVKSDFVLASSKNTLLAEGPHPPPTASITIGMKLKPSLMHTVWVSM